MQCQKDEKIKKCCPLTKLDVLHNRNNTRSYYIISVNT